MSEATPNHPHEHGHDHGHAHAHAHGHAHGHAHHDGGPEPQGEMLDPASRALSGALLSSFAILKWIMLVLVVLFLFSGTFRVKEGEVALRLRFGALQGETGEQVLKPGGPYFAWPEPAGRVIFVPTSTQRLTLDREFWFHQEEADRAKKIEDLPVPSGGLVPGQDGSLLTADRNLVHAQWAVSYKVEPQQALSFVQNVGSLERASQLVRAAAEQAIVQVAARTTADDFVNGRIKLDEIQRQMQASLEQLQSGLTATGVLVKEKTAPLAVRSSFTTINEAQSAKAKKISEAKQEEYKILRDLAGAGYQELLEAIDAYEQARRGSDTSVIEAAYRRVQEHLESDNVQGEVNALLKEAQANKDKALRALSGDAKNFERLLPQYKENREIFRERARQDALQEILSGNVEKFYLPAGSDLYLQVGRDPEIRKRKESEKYQLEKSEKK